MQILVFQVKGFTENMKHQTDPLHNVNTENVYVQWIEILTRNFCATPARYNKTHFTNNIQALIRQIKLNAHFKDQAFNPEEQVKKMYNLKWTLNKNHHTIKKFTQAFSNDVKNKE